MVGDVPDLAARWDAGAFVDHVSIDGKARADAGSQRDADGARDTRCGSRADFAKQVSGGIVEEADLLRLPVKAPRERLA